jgi:hypothetical protein
MNDYLLFNFFKHYSCALNNIKIINIHFNTICNLHEIEDNQNSQN